MKKRINRCFVNFAWAIIIIVLFFFQKTTILSRQQKHRTSSSVDKEQEEMFFNDKFKIYLPKGFMVRFCGLSI